MATAALSPILPLTAHTTLSPSMSNKPPSPLWAARPFPRPFAPSLRTKSPFSANSPPSSVNGASSTAVEDGQQSGDISISIDVLKRFIDLNLGSWKGSFHQFDCNGNLLYKISTKLAGGGVFREETPTLKLVFDQGMQIFIGLSIQRVNL